jgi:hypothetical protein
MKNKYLALVDGMFNPFRNKHMLLHSELPIYDLKIGRQQFATLQQVADQAMRHGWMSDDLKTWVKAKFIHDGETYSVRVRLRGDLNRNWKGPKKSYRIKFGTEVVTHEGEPLRVDKYFRGKRQINLILPHNKFYALGPFINDVMREKGLVVPDDRFVVLRINGVIHGLYYEVEHFDEPLLAGNARPETVVFDHDSRATRKERYSALGMASVGDAGLDMGSLRRHVETLDDLGLRAMQVLVDHSLDPSPESFRRVRAVMDWEKYLNFRAMATICNSNHARFGTDDLKLYYDSSRGLLEPIPWDVYLSEIPHEPGTVDFYNSDGPDAIQRSMLMDPQLRLWRNEILWELVADSGDSLLAMYDRIHDSIRTLVWTDVLSTPVQAYKMDEVRNTLAHNIRRIARLLEYSSGNLNYRLESDTLATIEFATLNFSGLRLHQMTIADSTVFRGNYRLHEDSNDNGVFDASDLLIAESKDALSEVAFTLDVEVLPEVEYGSDRIRGRYWEFFEPHAGRRRFFLLGRLAPAVRHPLFWSAPHIAVATTNAVTGELVATQRLDAGVPVPGECIGVRAWDGSDTFDLDAIDRSLADFLDAHPQFQSSVEHKGSVELTGVVLLTETVIVPRSVPLIIRPGADVSLASGASVLCYGGLTSVGTPDRRIRVHGATGAPPWGTFAAVRPERTVRIHYTDFSDGGQAQVNGILFTGGFAVHGGDLELLHCRFTGMQSEDAINIKNGHVLMTHTLVEDSASDGIDIDAGTGEVRDSRFADNAGDGIDISYSVVTLSGNHLEGIGDKGISVGERSQLTVLNNLIQECSIGISCKDLSAANVAFSTFVGNKLAIEAKRKKPMFGGGSGEFVNCVFAENDTLLREDWFSRGQIALDHSLVDAELDDEVAALRFMAPESGDYRLSPASLTTVPFEVIETTWPSLDPYPTLPGIFAPIGPHDGLVQRAEELEPTLTRAPMPSADPNSILLKE